MLFYGVRFTFRFTLFLNYVVLAFHFSKYSNSSAFAFLFLFAHFVWYFSSFYLNFYIFYRRYLLWQHIQHSFSMKRKQWAHNWTAFFGLPFRDSWLLCVMVQLNISTASLSLFHFLKTLHKLRDERQKISSIFLDDVA